MLRPAAEAREAEARIREAQQKHQELESERAVLRHKALASRAAEQVRPMPSRTPSSAHFHPCTFLTGARGMAGNAKACAESSRVVIPIARSAESRAGLPMPAAFPISRYELDTAQKDRSYGRGCREILMPKSMSYNLDLTV